jgi:hypothetical protein
VSALTNTITALILIGSDITSVEEAGDFVFTCLPRIGEEIVLELDGRSEVLKVAGVTHSANPVESNLRSPTRLIGPLVWLRCEKI